MHKDGHSIPFETFLGFNGDKIPDIDLNFSGDYQPTAMEYIRGVFGYDNSFRGGTVSTISTELAYGYVKGYAENKKLVLRDAEIDRLKTHILDVKRSTGQHPGGIVVVPNYADIFDVTPIQYPANDPTNSFRTTHFDYHSFENNLLKFDILAHDNPTVLKYIMDYVHLHQADFPFDNIDDIPIADQKIYELCNGTEVIGLTKEELHSQVASFGMPELGTNFVRGMLVETKPKTFAQLVKISGLSHGTLVWQGNAQELVKGTTEYGKIEFKDIIGCRDDIMVDLMDMGMEPGKAFKIMEFVRKNKKAKDPEGWVKLKTQMQEANVPLVLRYYPMTITEEQLASEQVIIDFDNKETATITKTFHSIPTKTYVCDNPMEFPSVGVRVQYVTITVTPLEIRIALDYEITDLSKYQAQDDGLWFEFINPNSSETEPYAQRVSAGLTSGGSIGRKDGLHDLPDEVGTVYRQTDAIGLDALSDQYSIRAYSAWDKTRYETVTFHVTEMD